MPLLLVQNIDRLKEAHNHQRITPVDTSARALNAEQFVWYEEWYAKLIRVSHGHLEVYPITKSTWEVSSVPVRVHLSSVPVIYELVARKIPVREGR